MKLWIWILLIFIISLNASNKQDPLKDLSQKLEQLVQQEEQSIQKQKKELNAQKEALKNLEKELQEKNNITQQAEEKPNWKRIGTLACATGGIIFFTAVTGGAYAGASALAIKYSAGNGLYAAAVASATPAKLGAIVGAFTGLVDSAISLRRTGSIDFDTVLSDSTQRAKGMGCLSGSTHTLFGGPLKPSLKQPQDQVINIEQLTVNLNNNLKKGVN